MKTEKPIELQYKLYMDIVKRNIKETRSRMKKLPEMERPGNRTGNKNRRTSHKKS